MAYQFLDSRDIVAGFYPRYEQSVAGLYFPAISMELPSDRETENYKWVGQASAMREWVGGRQANPLNKQSYNVTNKKYESTMEIKRDDLRRDKTGLLRIRVSEMAQKAAENPQTLIAALINANPLCYDGQNLYDTDHSEGTSGTQVNELTVTQVAAANVSDAANPTATEMANVLIGAVGWMYGFKDDKGDPCNGSLRSFHVLCSTPAQWSAAVAATTLANLASGATNPVSGIMTKGVSFRVDYDPRLTTLAAAYQFTISAMDGATKPFINQIEKPLETELVGEGTEYAFKNDAHLFGVNETRAVAPGFWQKTVRVTLS